MHDDETLPARVTMDSRARPAQAPGGVARTSAPRVGDVLLRRYRIEAELGRGGQAQVFEALDLELERRIALKALLPGLLGDDTRGWQQLLDEARLQADVETPGVARLLDALRDGERRYLLMELVRGPELRAVIDALHERATRQGLRPAHGGWLADAAELADDAPARAVLRRLSWDRAVASFGARLSDVVAGLHARGLVHRDLKPGNVKLDPRGAPVVLDFGLAGRLSDAGEEPARGTPRYMAPEQLDERRQRRDPRTDVHQLGLILFELLTLRPARREASMPALLERVRAGQVPDAGSVDGRADPGLAAVIARATQPDAERRYADAAALAADLRRVARGQAPDQAPTPLGYRARRRLALTLRNAWFRAAAAAVVLALTAWFVRSAVEPDVTNVEAWRFRPGAETLQVVAPGSAVRADDDLGVRITSNHRTWLYALSIYGGEQAAEQRIAPLYPLLLVDGQPIARDDASWSLRVEAGEREVLCARLSEPSAWEGLLVFAAREPVPRLEDWLRALDALSTRSGEGVAHAAAFALLDELGRPTALRGRRIDPAATSERPDRYASLDGSRAAGLGDWDLGADLVRYELLCRLATP